MIPLRNFPITVVIISLFFISGCGERGNSPPPPEPTKNLDSLFPYDENWPPLVIYISIDTLRADHLGCYGYGRNTSGHIDDFARDGMIYEACISQSPYTPTSHASMLTGISPIRHMTFEVLGNEFVTMAEVFSKLGYKTISYNGNGYLSEKYGFSQGFDEYRSYPGSPGEGSDISWVISGAIHAISSWEGEGRDAGLFCFIHTYEVHASYDPPDDFEARFVSGKAPFPGGKNELLKRGDIVRYLGDGNGWGPGNINRYRKIPEPRRRRFIDLYDAEIAFTDAWLGRLFDFLKEERLYDRALIIVNSDHGEEFYEHGGWCHSHSLYGEVINVPLIIKYPENKKRGRESERVARNIDVLPTILFDVLGIDVEIFGFDGVPLSKNPPSLSSVSVNFSGKNLSRLAIYLGQTKYIRNYLPYAEAEPARPDEELFRFTRDPLDKKPLPIASEAELGPFRELSEVEKKTFDANRIMLLEKKGGIDLSPSLTGEEKDRLKDLGYMQ